LSTDNPAVKLPTSSPTDIDTRLLGIAPCPPPHCKEVSDAHDVLSFAVEPCRDIAEYKENPRFAPFIVKSVDPVETALVLEDVDREGRLYVTAAET
jgi:hypothetical protein